MNLQYMKHLKKNIYGISNKKENAPIVKYVFGNQLINLCIKDPNKTLDWYVKNNRW